MKLKIIRKKECIGRVIQFGQHEDVVFTVDETALFDELVPVKAMLDTAGTQQAAGNLAFRESSDEREFAALATRQAMRDIAEIAKALHGRGIDVGALEGFRMPRPGTFENLGTKATAFAEQAEPRKALFIARGLPPTFVEDLLAKAATLSVAGTATGSELSRQVGGTSGLDVYADRGMDIVRELRAIMRVKLREMPIVLAEWNSLSRVHSTGGSSAGTEAPAPVPPPSGGTGS